MIRVALLLAQELLHLGSTLLKGGPMVRLTVVTQTPEKVVVKVEGWVSGADVALLSEEGTRLLQESERLLLDLNGVRFIDREGVALLQRWSKEGAVLRGGSLFVRGLLEKHGLM